jgi:dUTP pyrophosphatase|tara:strand:- start:56921 stop:57547 length:627 start_codon:yes stop_codon:yes gene_type:complete
MSQDDTGRIEKVFGHLVDKYESLSEDATLEELSELTRQITDATNAYNDTIEPGSTGQPMDKIMVNLGYANESENEDPEYAYKSDSGFDLRASENKVIKPKEVELIGTGLSFDIPRGFEIQVRSRSGLSLKKNLFVLNSPGTIDQGYIGEIKIILANFGHKEVEIEKGDRIAQACLCPVVTGEFVDFINNVKNKKTERGSGGFGSTGNK